MSTIDPVQLRRAFGAFPTGVTVVTTRDAHGRPLGFTANSFASVSLDPPLLLVCPARTLSSFDAFAGCDRFAVNVLAEGQQDISNVFATHRGERFSEIAWREDESGRPLIDGTAAGFGCRTERVVDAGDHVILIGRVESFDASGRRGLGYASGHYFSLGLEREAAAAPRQGLKAVAGAIVERDDRVLLESTPHGYRPPQVALSGRSRVRAALAEHLAAIGVEASIGKAYSIFDDAKTGTHYSYFIASAASDAHGAAGELVPVDALARLRYVSDAHGEMMKRFALESRQRCFGLYVGDEQGGDVHEFN